MPLLSPIKTQAAAALAIGLAFAAPSLAQEHPPLGAGGGQHAYPASDVRSLRAAREACLADIDHLCPGVIPGGGRIVRCLAVQRESLSPGCWNAIEAARALFGF